MMRPFGVCLRGLLATVRPVRWKLAVSCVLGLMEVALSLAFVLFSKKVVDIATGVSDAPFSRCVIIFVSVMLAQIAVRVASRYWEGYVEVRTRNSTRSAVFAKVMRSIWSGKEKLHSGDTVNRLEEDIRVVVDFLVCALPQIFVTICQMLAASILLFSLSSELGWILIFIMPVAVIGSRLYFRKMRSITMEIRKGDSRVQEHMQESIQHRMVVRTMGSTDDVIDSLDGIQDEVQAKTITRLNYSAISRAFLQLGFFAGYAAAFVWSVYGIKEGVVTYGLMTAFLQLVGQVQRPVANLTQQIPAFIRALSSEDRLLELSSLEQEQGGEDILLEGAPGIILRDLSFSYEDSGSEVISNLDFDFKPGSFTAITGPTGAGKSTLVKIILSLLKPDRGSVELYEPRTPVSASTLCNFMYVPQGNSLMSGTIRQNLLLAAPDASEGRLWKVLDDAEAGFVRDLPAGLDTVCAEVGAGLSEGQAQRIAIARALLRPGGILVLDEATSALDADTENSLLGNIAREYKGRKTILCITHRPAASVFADYELKIS